MSVSLKQFTVSRVASYLSIVETKEKSLLMSAASDADPSNHGLDTRVRRKPQCLAACGKRPHRPDHLPQLAELSSSELQKDSVTEPSGAQKKRRCSYLSLPGRADRSTHWRLSADGAERTQAETDSSTRSLRPGPLHRRITSLTRKSATFRQNSLGNEDHVRKIQKGRRAPLLLVFLLKPSPWFPVAGLAVTAYRED